MEEEDSAAATIVLGEKQPIQIDKHILPIKEQKSEHGVSDSLIQDNIDSLVKNVAELDILKLDIKNPTTKVKNAYTLVPRYLNWFYFIRWLIFLYLFQG